MARITLRDGAPVSGEILWANAEFVKVRQEGAGGDVTTRKFFDGGFYDMLVVSSLYDWSDALRPERDAASFSYVLGGGMTPFESTRFGLEWEHSMNRLVGQRFRVLATLELSVLK